MNLLLKELEKSPKYKDFLEQIKNKKSPVEISGLTDVLNSEILSSTLENLKRPIFIVTYNEIQAHKLYQNLSFFTDKVLFLPKKEIVTYDYVAESKNLPYERIDVLNKIYKEENLIIIASIETIKQKIITKKALYKNTINLKVGDRCDLEELKQKLIQLGYQRFELIDGRGEFSVRGGIIDVSINDTIGVRIELWGDEIDSIRNFNIISQRSIENKETTCIYPAYEYILDEPLNVVAKNIKETIYPEVLAEKVESDTEKILEGDYLNKIDRYFNSFYKEQETILDYLSENYIIFMDEYSKIIGRSKSIEEDNENVIKALIEKERIVPESIKNYLSTEEVELKIQKYKNIFLNKLDNLNKNGIDKYNFNARELNYFKSGI